MGLKAVFLLGSIFLNNVSCTPVHTVYICDSNGAKRYHYTVGCRGLNNCQHEILKVTLEHARQKGRDLCHLED